MFVRWERSWQLVQASWQVLKQDRELVVFPIISSIALIVVAIMFIIPVVASGVFDAVTQDNANNATGIAELIVAFLFYLVNYTVIFFANSALVGAAMIRLNGGDPTVQDGIRIASERFSSILGYAAISATVGVILRMVSERSNMLGRIVISIIGFVWNVATFLVVPILVVEKLTPIDAIKRSAELVKTTWGEQIVGNFGVGTVFGLLYLGLIVVCVAVGVLGGAINLPALTIAAVIFGVIGFVILGVLSSTLQGIFTAALYKYATSGSAGEMFEESLVREAFRQK